MPNTQGAIDLTTFKAYSDVHLRSDTDKGPLSIHHTLGGLPSQAAPGDHGHTALAVGGYGTPGTAAIGDVPSEGSATSVSRADHRHGMPGFANPIALAFGDTIAQGSSSSLPRADHRHGMPAAPVIPPPITDLEAFGIYAGSGTPESNVTAPKGSLFLRDDGGAGTSLYVKETGAGNTGWVGK